MTQFLAPFLVLTQVLAPFLALSGEVRTPLDPRSTLFNTDGQCFSDAGIPVVLFMENYDISRKGYHDTHDTLENIDLDYCAAMIAIAIEAVADTACASLFERADRRELAALAVHPLDGGAQ